MLASLLSATLALKSPTLVRPAPSSEVAEWSALRDYHVTMDGASNGLRLHHVALGGCTRSRDDQHFMRNMQAFNLNGRSDDSAGFIAPYGRSYKDGLLPDESAASLDHESISTRDCSSTCKPQMQTNDGADGGDQAEKRRRPNRSFSELLRPLLPSLGISLTVLSIDTVIKVACSGSGGSALLCKALAVTGVTVAKTIVVPTVSFLGCIFLNGWESDCALAR